tara:strand:- start:1377 stop:1532 length:156 start_codon:yes stop_codon:yes gene_type:complete
MVSPTELMWGLLALQIVALIGIGGIVASVATLTEKQRGHDRRLTRLERKTT